MSTLCFQLASTQLANYSFPKNFSFGVATASYQIEGAFNEDGKTDSIWDYNLHMNPNRAADRTNGDVTCDSYHNWQQDIQLIKDLGVNFYRFSIAWTRILPSGNKGSEVNEKGVSYYNNLIDKLLAEGITPVVTIYHWDLPQSLQENGGWLNETIIDNYVFYAKTLFELFGDRVKQWITFNEPSQICEAGYTDGTKAPFLTMLGTGGYICAHNVLLSHGRTYREYQKLFKATQGGIITMSTDSAWFEPKENSDSDREAAERNMQFSFGWFVHPLIKGNYPSIMIERIDEISENQEFKESRLPKFTESEIEMMRGSLDFISLNHYTTVLVKPLEIPCFLPINYCDCGVEQSDDPEWEVSATSPWLKKVPWGLRKLLVWIKEEYENLPVLISENGWSNTRGLNDSDRVSYLKEYLAEILKAIHEDGCNVIGYTHWSLLDNFEWTEGFSSKFGLVDVDFDSSEKTRTAKDSYWVYQEIIKSRRIN